MSTNPNQRNRAPAPPPFVMSPAKFNGTSLLLGLVSPSGGGKTKSALELARGIQVVTGGKIGILDTENGRSLHYAKEYEFKLPDGTDGLFHLPFDPPFNPARYQAAYEHMIKGGIKIIITDSFSHEHDGIGGVLEMHEEALERGVKDPSAWGPAKGERRELIGYILQVKSVFWIFCFRAREKMRWIKGQAPEARGLMPQGNEQFIFEQTASFLLPAGANGVPVLSSPYPDEELILKLPSQFRHLFTEPRQLSAALGTHLAAWAVPSWKGVLPPLPTPMKRGQSASVGYSATMAKTLSVPTIATVAELISKFETITDYSTMGDLRTAYDTVRATASPEDVVRLNAAKDACFDRLDPIGVDAAAPLVATPIPAALVKAVESVVDNTAPSPLEILINAYESAVSIAAVDALEPATKSLLATLTDKNSDRLKAAANAAIDRLDPPVVTDPSPVTIVNSAKDTERALAKVDTAAAVVSAPPRVLSEIEQLNRDGLAAFRESLNSFGETITQEQAAQLVRDHLSEYAKPPKVGTEDGAMAQDEIMKRTQPPFASRASLGVMRRHLEQCDAYPTYKQFCNVDLPLCTTAENVFELWQMSGEVIDALPKQPQTDARLRAVKKVEDVDPTIKDGGPWLTKRIREAKANVAAAAKTLGTITPAAAALAVVHAAGSNGAAANAPPELSPSAPVVPPPPDPTPNHAPITSDVGQVLAVDLEKAVTLEATDEMRTRVDRAFLQKRIPTADAKTLQALCEAKKATFAAATA